MHREIGGGWCRCPGCEVAGKGRRCGGGDWPVMSWPVLCSCLGLWGKLSKDLDAWVGLCKYDFWVNLGKRMGKDIF